jgi:hypothetical protein
MGFRVVLATLAIETDADKERFAKATAAAASPDIGTAYGVAEANAIAELEQVARITDQAERLSRLTEIARILDTARTERNDQRNRAIEAVLIAAATSCNTAFQQLRNLNFYRRKLTEAKEVMDEIYAIRDAGDITQEELDQIPSLERAYERILNNVTRTEARVRTHIGSYAEFIDTLRRDYSSSVTDPILPLTRARMDGSGLSVMSACLGIAASHLEIARIDGRLDVDQWQSDFEKIIKN